MKKILILQFCWLTVSNAIAQPARTSLEHSAMMPYEYGLNTDSTGFHPSIKPWLYNELKTAAGIQQNYLLDDLLSGRDSSNTNKGAEISVYPLTGIRIGWQKIGIEKVLPYTMIGAGVHVKTSKLFIHLSYLAAQGRYQEWLNAAIDSSKSIPSVNYAYRSGKGFHNKYADGYISYSPMRIFNFQAGFGKHFLGNGYRSMFLSDDAPSYPFLAVRTHIWHFEYLNLYANFKDNSAPADDYWKHRNKYGTFHYLSWQVCRTFNLQLYESIIWMGSDTLVNRSFDVNYLNPIIFYRPVEFSVGSADNAFMGAGFSYRPADHWLLYGQLLLDEFLLKEIRNNNDWWGNKYAWQAGCKYLNAFEIKGLNLLAEYNGARPYTYSHGQPYQNYSHEGQALAHPLGANFSELLLFSHYTHNKWFIEASASTALTGLDSAGLNFGSNIFKSYETRFRDYGNYLGQGLKTQLFTASMMAGLYLSEEGNLQLRCGAVYRESSNKTGDDKNIYLFLGLRSVLWNTAFNR